MNKKQMKKEIEKRRASASVVARDIGISPAYLTTILRDMTTYPPSEDIMKKLEKWFNTCHVCGREWPHEEEKN